MDCQLISSNKSKMCVCGKECGKPVAGIDKGSFREKRSFVTCGIGIRFSMSKRFDYGRCMQSSVASNDALVLLKNSRSTRFSRRGRPNVRVIEKGEFVDCGLKGIDVRQGR